MFTTVLSTLPPLLQEDIADLEKRSQSRDVKEWVLVFLSRLLANVFVFVILAAAGAAIYYAAVLGLENVHHTVQPSLK